MLREFRGWKYLLVVVALACPGGAEETLAQVPPPSGTSGQRPAVTQFPQPPTRPPATVPPRRQQVPLPPRAPFQLTEQQFRQMYGVLQAWEAESSKVETFAADLTIWENDVVFGKQTVRRGSIKYKTPDSGLYEVEDPAGARNEKWVCNGKSIYEFRFNEKQLKEYVLPPEMQGKAISQSPLPFVFGAKAEELLKRYFMRLVTPTKAEQTQIWIEAYPRMQAQASSFKRATIILQRSDLMPYAVEFYFPNGNRTVQQFDKTVINSRNVLNEFLTGDPFNPRTPFGWEKVVERPDSRPAGPTPPQNASRSVPPPR